MAATRDGQCGIVCCVGELVNPDASLGACDDSSSGKGVSCEKAFLPVLSTTKIPETLLRTCDLL